MKKYIFAALLLGIVIAHFVLLNFQARGITVNVSNEVLVNIKPQEDLEKEIEQIKEEKKDKIEEYERIREWNKEIRDYIQ